MAYCGSMSFQWVICISSVCETCFLFRRKSRYMLTVTDSLKNILEEGVRFPGVVTGGCECVGSNSGPLEQQMPVTAEPPLTSLTIRFSI